MKLLVLSVLCFLHVTAYSTTYYLSPTGNDNNTGSISSPWWTINRAWAAVSPGDTIYMRGGTYTYTIQQYLTGKNGSAGNSIKIWNYPGEVPVITRHASNYTPTNPWGRKGPSLIGNFIHLFI